MPATEAFKRDSSYDHTNDVRNSSKKFEKFSSLVVKSLDSDSKSNEILDLPNK